MSDLIESRLEWLGAELPSRLSRPGDPRYAAATAIWAKPVGPMPRAVVHCATTEDVQWGIRVARDCDLALSVRSGGHDWAGRALCDGIVLDLTGMKEVIVDIGSGTAEIAGGALASEVAAVADSLGGAVAAGACSMVGLAGLTMGGGYGALIGRYGLALDNLLGAEVVLADGRIVMADAENEPELYWALRGGGGNFGVVTGMRHRVHDLPSVHAGTLIYPLAKDVLARCVALAESAPDELTVQIALAFGPDGAPAVMILPTWCGRPEEGECLTAPFSQLGTVFVNTMTRMSYGAALALVDPFIVNGRRTFMETCWLPALDDAAIDIFIQAMKSAVSPGCCMFTHEFRGAAARVAPGATAFGLRRDHVLIEIIAACIGPADAGEEQRHRQWARSTLRAFDALALPGGYPNLLGADDADRAAKSYGDNAGRLLAAKKQYDPDNVFRSAIPLPARCKTLRLR